MLKISKYIKNHENWKTELTDYPYYLKISEDGNYICFKYSQIDSDFSNPIVKECRGIIFKKDEWNHPVCYAFDKFFNLGEPNCAEVDFESSLITQKIDGSLMKLWYCDNEWHLSTNGMIDAYKATINDSAIKSFGDLFELALSKYNLDFTTFTKDLDKSFTYIFELVSPYNRVVIPYSEPSLYYLGMRENETFQEVRFCVYNPFAHFEIPTPKVYKMNSIQEVIQSSMELPWDEEGYVVVDDYCNRCKIKSPAYVLAHYSRMNGNVSDKHLMQIILAHQESEFLIYAKDYERRLCELTSLKLTFEAECLKVYLRIHALDTITNRKDFAEQVSKEYPIFKSFLFWSYDHAPDIREFTRKWDANKWIKVLENFQVYFN